MSDPMAYIAIDLETTSLNPRKARIVQLGVVLLDKDMVQQAAWNQLINPGCPIPGEATARHGLTTADVQGEATFDKVAGRLRDLVLKRVVIGYNVGYDLMVLHREFRLAGLSGIPPNMPVLDAYKIFCRQHPRTLEAALQTYCGIKHPRPHDALQDILATLQVLRAQLAIDGEEPGKTDFIAAQEKFCMPGPYQSRPEAVVA